jgi:hypothetical protein
MKSCSTRRALCGVTTISKASLRVPLLSTGAPAQLADLLDADASPEEVGIAYHERTKHYFHRYAASLGCMDWATQTDLFRRYPGADLVRLRYPNRAQVIQSDLHPRRFPPLAPRRELAIP